MSITLGIGLGLTSQRGGEPSYAANGFEPAIAFDFSTNYFRKAGASVGFSDLFANARASTATYTDSTGVIQTASSGVARTENYTYNGTSWVGPKCLIEPDAGTNIILQSDEFSNATWVKTAVAVTSDQETGPFGPLTMDKLTSDGVNSFAKVVQTVSMSGAVTFSIFARAGTSDKLTMRISGTDINGGGNSNSTYDFTFSTGLFSYNTGGTATTNAEDWGSGLYRLSMSIASSTAVSSTLLYPEFGTASGVTLFVGAAQLEAGTVRSSYIPTTSSTVTRALETLIIPAANLASVVNTTAMSASLKGMMSYADTSVNGETVPIWWFKDASNNIQIAVDTIAAETGLVRFQQKVGGVSDIVESSATAYAPAINVPFSIASRHTSGALNGAVDGIALTENTTPVALPTLSAQDFELATVGIHNIEQGSLWGIDIGDIGIAEASA